MGPPLAKFIAVDCEMVSLRQSDDSMALARVALVDHEGSVIYDSLVHVPHEAIKNYNTRSSGISVGDLEHAPHFTEVRSRVRELLRGKILVGHALFNDLAVLQIRYAVEKTRDTALYYPLRQVMGVQYEGQYPGLKKCSRTILNEEIQEAEHDPVIDARMSMKLYLHHRDDWERSISRDDDVTACVPGHFAEWYF